MGSRGIWMMIGLVAASVSGCGQQSSETSSQTVGQGKTASRHLISPDEVEVLERQGLTSPVQQIVSSLRAHPEVIPHEGVLGGSMGFYADRFIHVLNARTVFAEFTDGHIQGSGVFEYTIEPDTTISWRVLSSRIEGPR